MNGNFGTSKAIQPIKVLIEDLILGHPIDPSWTWIFLLIFGIAYWFGAVVFDKNENDGKSRFFKGIAALSFIASMIVGEWLWVGFLVSTFVAWWWGWWRRESGIKASEYREKQRWYKKQNTMGPNEYNLEYSIEEIKELEQAIRDAEREIPSLKEELRRARRERAIFERTVAEERGEIPKGKEGVDYEWVEEDVFVEVYKDNGEEVHKDNEKEV